MVARRAHNPEAAGSSPVPATIKIIPPFSKAVFYCYFQDGAISFFNLLKVLSTEGIKKIIEVNAASTPRYVMLYHKDQVRDENPSGA